MADTKSKSKSDAAGTSQARYVLVRNPGGEWHREPVAYAVRTIQLKGKPTRTKVMEVHFEDIQRLVGGGYFNRIFSATAENPFSVYVNEEGIPKKLPYCLTVVRGGGLLDVLGPVVVVRSTYDPRQEAWYSATLEDGDDEAILALGIWAPDRPKL